MIGEKERALQLQLLTIYANRRKEESNLRATPLIGIIVMIISNHQARCELHTYTHTMNITQHSAQPAIMTRAVACNALT